MLSRVAESIYWMSRYLERAENIARFIEVNWYMTLDLPDADRQDWSPLINATGDVDDFNERYPDASRDNVIQFLTFDKEYAGSILSCAIAARENARGIRDRISPELWEQVNAFYHMLRSSENTAEYISKHVNEYYARIKLAGLTFGGIVNDTMAHGEGWHFFRMGRLLERADKTSRILDVKYFMLLPKVEYVGSPYDNIQWAALLRSTSALETYRQLNGQIDPNKVVEFLVLNDHFPRAIRHCLGRVEESVRNVTGTAPGYFANSAGQQLGQFLADLSYTTVENIMAQGLHESIDRMQQRMNTVDSKIFETFFDISTKTTAEC